jgi:transposase
VGILARAVDHVIGVDTHRDTHTAAVVDPTGGVVAEVTVPADGRGYHRLLVFANTHAPVRRVWAIEGSGSFGVGLTTSLLERGEWVVEVDRPLRAGRRNGAKTDEIDAVRAAREALSREHLAEPRRRGEREALRVLLGTRRGAVESRTRAIAHLKALIVTAPDYLRRSMRWSSSEQQVLRCMKLRTTLTQSTEHRATVLAMRCTARRIVALDAEVTDLTEEIRVLVDRLAPQLLAESGVGPVSAAQLLCAWSHAGRLRSEAAFAALAGVAPIPASSGQTVRHRLNRAGDRQVNRALHTIVLSRLAHDPETKAYAERRKAEGKTPREIKRCLKRHLARRLFKLMERSAVEA